jgi:hypothetical protein
MKVTTKVGHINVTGETVTIARRALLGQGGEKRTIRIEDLKGLDFKQATLMSAGHLRLIYDGSAHPALNLRYYDANVIMFDLSEQQKILPVREHLMSMITGHPFQADDIRSQTTPILAFQAVIAILTITVVVYLATQ